MRNVISDETIKEINAVIDEILTNIDDNVRNIVGAGNYSLPTIFSYTNYSGQTINVHGSTFRHEIIIDNADGNNLIGDICTVIGDRNGIKLAKAGVEDRHDAFANYWDSTIDIAYSLDNIINGYVFDMHNGYIGEGANSSTNMSFKIDGLEIGKSYTLTFTGRFARAEFVVAGDSYARICSDINATPYIASVTLEKDTVGHVYRLDFTNNTQSTTLYLNFDFLSLSYEESSYVSEFIAENLVIAGMNIGIISRYMYYNRKWYPIEAGGGTSDLDAIELTYAEYQALTPAEKTDPDKIYFITDYPSGSGVVINPTGTATDTAETIEVDGTIYDFMDADAIHTADIGVAGGVAELDSNGKVPSSQLPTYPTVGDGTITIQKNGTNVNTFTTNQSSNKTVNITMSKSDVGLGNVNNTSDADKPISTATQAALDGKADASDVDGVKTVTGNPITLTDGSETYADELVVDLEPIQSGSGTPSPSNVRPIQGYDIVSVDRCGKNLFDGALKQGASSEYVINTNKLKVKPNTTYYWVEFNWSNSGSKQVFFYDLSNSLISYQDVSGNSFTTPANCVKVTIQHYKSGGLSIPTNPQIVISTTLPTQYEPYNGQTVSLQLGNKNLLPMTVEGIKAANSGATWTGNSCVINNVTFTILTDENGCVTGIKANGTANANTSFKVCAIDNSWGKIIMNGNAISNGSDSSALMSLSLPTGDAFGGRFLSNYGGNSNEYDLQYDNRDKVLYLGIASGYNAQNIVFHPMIRYSYISDPTFSPYNPALGGMIYGATVDVANGVMVVDRVYREFTANDSNTWHLLSGYSNTFYCAWTKDSIAPTATGTDGVCSSYNVVRKVIANLANGEITLNHRSISSAYSSACVKDTQYSTAADFKASLTTPLQVCYELATPITIPLTPAQLKLLKGQNYISSNGTTIHLTYQPDNAVGDAVSEAEKFVERFRPDTDIVNTFNLYNGNTKVGSVSLLSNGFKLLYMNSYDDGTVFGMNIPDKYVPKGPYQRAVVCLEDSYANPRIIEIYQNHITVTEDKFEQGNTYGTGLYY